MTGKVRYAVVGLGHIAQGAVLPAFAHAGDNSVLTALVSDDPLKRRELGRRYGVAAWPYTGFEDCLGSGQVDAVYIALPNTLHADFAIRAAKAGVHVLCEKPLAVSEEECRQVIEACEANDIRLMTAYRLHFEEANLTAIELARSGILGDLRLFNSVFTMQVREGNIRVRPETGGGTLYDLGVYCINAARGLFRAEPVEAFAFSANNGEKRFHGVDEMSACVLRFPGERLASFSTSFGAADASSYRLLGSKGEILCEPAYEHAGALRLRLTVDGKTDEQTFAARDQFAAELLYFSDCVLKKKEPEPSGWEGLADVRIVEALYRSAELSRPVALAPFERRRRPDLSQEIHRPPLTPPAPVHAPSPHPPGP